MKEAPLLAVFVEAVQHGEIAFTGHAEGVGDALRHEAFDDQVAGELCVLGHGSWGMMVKRSGRRGATPAGSARAAMPIARGAPS
jgi:hypothetical protein